MEVINKYDLPVWQTEVFCHKCFSDSLAKAEDLCYRKVCRATMYFYYNSEEFYVHCPVCSEIVEIDMFAMPELLMQSIKDKYPAETSKSQPGIMSGLSLLVLGLTIVVGMLFYFHH